MRCLIAIARTGHLEDALARMRQHGSHVAKSVDEGGTTKGLLFLEDVIEVVAGEIQDATVA